MNLYLRRMIRRARTAHRQLYARMFSGFVPYIIVNEFPKCGGSWLTDMLSDALGMKSGRKDPIKLKRTVVNGHFLDPRFLSNVVVIWRDPRDMIVSFYHHCYFENEHENEILTKFMKRHLAFENYADVSGNLPRFIEAITLRPLAPSFTWPQFVDRWAERPGTVETRYEALRHDTANELKRVVREVAKVELSDERATEVAERQSFARVKAKAIQSAGNGVEMSFVREGSTGGWRKHFSQEALGTLERLGYREPMKRLGYEL